MTALCPWPIDTTCWPDYDGLNPDHQLAVAAATEVLWALSGRVYGQCPQTVQVCYDRAYEPCCGGNRWTPVLSGGGWSNISCGCGSSCWDCNDCEADLFSANLGLALSITAVRVGGDMLAPAAYELRGNRWLVRTDGSCWPTSACEFEVDGVFGQFISPLAQRSLGELARWWFERCEEANKCGLPGHVTNRSVDGATITYPSVQEMIAQGGTSLVPVDNWLATTPGKDGPPRVWSPHGPTVRVVGSITEHPLTV